MELKKVCGMLASFLLLTSLGDATKGCKCRPRNALQGYCLSDFVMKARFLEITDDIPKLERRYKVNIIQVYKGPKTLKGNNYLYTSSHIGHCGYEHPRPFDQHEYLITGTMSQNRLTTTFCHLNRTWNTFSHAQKLGLKGDYEYGCKYIPKEPSDDDE